MKAQLSLLHAASPLKVPMQTKTNFSVKFMWSTITIESGVMFNVLYICIGDDWGAAMLRGKEVLCWLEHDAAETFLGKEERHILDGI